MVVPSYIELELALATIGNARNAPAAQALRYYQVIIIQVPGIMSKLNVHIQS